VTVIQRKRAREKKKQGKIACQTSSATGKPAVNEFACHAWHGSMRLAYSTHTNI